MDQVGPAALQARQEPETPDQLETQEDQDTEGDVHLAQPGPIERGAHDDISDAGQETSQKVYGHAGHIQIAAQEEASSTEDDYGDDAEYDTAGSAEIQDSDGDEVADYGDVDEEESIEAMWLNEKDQARRAKYWAGHVPPKHDAQTSQLLEDLGRCETTRCMRRVGGKLVGKTRFNVPHFFIIGWQKCATTSVFSYLRRHPQLMFGRVKEAHFFTTCVHAGAACRADNETQYLRDILRVKDAAALGLEHATVDASVDYAMARLHCLFNLIRPG